MITSTICKDTSAIRLHITGTGQEEYFIVGEIPSRTEAAEAARVLYEQIARNLSEHRLKIVHERVFGSLSVEHDVMSARRQAFTSFGISPENSVTYVEGRPPWGEGLAGVIVHAVFPASTEDVWTIMDGEIPCGRAWKDDDRTYVVLQNIQAPDVGSFEIASRPVQARLMIERAGRILHENGASCKDVVRTWFYLSDILDWYAGFNKARNEKYGEFGIMPGPGDKRLLLPASTGIQGESPTGAACAMDMLAVLGSHGDDPSARRLSSPVQLDTFRYGSAFARASVVRNGNTHLIQVSGTAAIDEHGVSLYPGNIRAQIDCSFDKVQTLLVQEGAGLKDICSATVFVKQPEYAEIFYEMAAAWGLEDFPCVCIVADVCREELLFEMDAEVIVQRR